MTAPSNYQNLFSGPWFFLACTLPLIACCLLPSFRSTCLIDRGFYAPRLQHSMAETLPLPILSSLPLRTQYPSVLLWKVVPDKESLFPPPSHLAVKLHITSWGGVWTVVQAPCYTGFILYDVGQVI